MLPTMKAQLDIAMCPDLPGSPESSQLLAGVEHPVLACSRSPLWKRIDCCSMSRHWFLCLIVALLCRDPVSSVFSQLAPFGIAIFHYGVESAAGV